MDTQSGLKDGAYNFHSSSSSATVPTNTISTICTYKIT